MTLPAYTGTLAPAHRQLIAGIGDQWAATVLSTDPVDRAAAVEAARRLYDTHKLRRPPLTVWMDSPLGCIFAAGVMGQLTETLRAQFVHKFRRHQLRYQLGRRLWGRSSLARSGSSSAATPGERLSGELEDQLSEVEATHRSLSSQLWDQLRWQSQG